MTVLCIVDEKNENDTAKPWGYIPNREPYTDVSYNNPKITTASTTSTVGEAMKRKEAWNADGSVREHILWQARKMILQERHMEYGPAAKMFGRIASLWSEYNGLSFTTTDVAVMMALVKIARLSNDPHHHDSWIDAIGYLALGAEMSQMEKEKKYPDIGAVE